MPYALSCVFATPVADWIGLKVSSVLADAGSALIMAIVAITGTIRAVGDRTKHVLLQPMADAAQATAPGTAR